MDETKREIVDDIEDMIYDLCPPKSKNLTATTLKEKLDAAKTDVLNVLLGKIAAKYPQE